MITVSYLENQRLMSWLDLSDDNGRVGVKLCVIYENQKLMSWPDLSDDYG